MISVRTLHRALLIMFLSYQTVCSIGRENLTNRLNENSNLNKCDSKPTILFPTSNSSVNTNNSPGIQPILDLYTIPGSRITIALSFTDPDSTDTHTIEITPDFSKVLVENLTGNISGSTFDLVIDKFWTGSSEVTVIVTDDSGIENDADTIQFKIIVLEEACGTILNNTTWSDDTVKIGCNLIIDSEACLTIQAGTVVDFQGSFDMVVYGTLKAIGHPGDSIKFTYCSTAGNPEWKGLKFQERKGNPEKSIMEYCIVEKVLNRDHSGLSPKGALSIIDYDNLVLSNCVIRKNEISNGFVGGGLHCQNSNPIILYCTIQDNKASANGGGLYFENSSPLVQGNTISYNEGGAIGGGICLYRSEGRVINNRIFYNRAYQGGGISAVESVNLQIIGNLVYGNQAYNSGGGIQFYGSSGKAVNNTVTLNTGSDYAGGIEINRSVVQLINSIIWNNSSANFPDLIIAVCDTIPDIRYCNFMNEPGSIFSGNNTDSVPGLWENNIESDPGFKGAGDLFFSLSEESMCRNSGTPDTSGLQLPEYDVYGIKRHHENTVDIGAAEYVHLHLSKKEISCYDENDGSIELQVFFGSGPYSYHWSNGETIEDILGLSPGMYAVSVEDQNGKTARDSVIIHEPDKLIAHIIDSANVSYYGYLDGYAIAETYGGTLPYDILWNDPNRSRNALALNLGGYRSYTVSLTDHNGCLADDSVYIEGSNQLHLNIIPVIDPVCYAASNGSAFASCFYAEYPVVYQWDDELNTMDSLVSRLEADIYYHVEITDAGGRTGHDSISISQMEKLLVGDISGPDKVAKSDTSVFSVSERQGSVFTWTIIGGEILKGQYTDQIEVFWESEGFGQIKVVEEDSCGCISDTSILQVSILPVGIEMEYSRSVDTNIRIFPIPFENELTIGFPNEGEEEYTLYIMDIYGRTCRIIEKITTSEFILKRRNLMSGYYTLVLKGPNIYTSPIIAR